MSLPQLRPLTLACGIALALLLVLTLPHAVVNAAPDDTRTDQTPEPRIYNPNSALPCVLVHGGFAALQYENPLAGKRIEQVRFEDVPLRDALAFIAEVTEVNMVVRWDQLDSLGVGSDVPINLELRDAAAQRVLELVLKLAGGVEVQLDYHQVDDRTLLVSTLDNLSRTQTLVIYDVSRIVNASRFVRRTSDAERMDSSVVMDELINLITMSVAPDTWMRNGGLGTLHPFAGTLTVRNTQPVHVKVHRTLEGLCKLLHAN